MWSLSRRMAVVGAMAVGFALTLAQTNPLPSWNDGPAKQAILEFVRTTTDASSPDFVPLAERVATFDDDGTLWVERPLPMLAAFAFARVAALASQHPDWKTTEPYQSILTHDRAAIEAFTEHDLAKIVAAAHAGMSVDAVQKTVNDWIASAKDDHFKRPYTSLVYRPMLEVLTLLRDHGYRTYIVTRGGKELARGFAQSTYGVPPEHVIGSAAKTRYERAAGQPSLIGLADIVYTDDGPGKPEAINLIIGRRPRAAFGNSTGDREMLEWTQAGGGARLMLLVHHDDAEREYAYGPTATVGKFDDPLMKEAMARQWIVVSVKNDWKRIFPLD